MISLHEKKKSHMAKPILEIPRSKFTTFLFFLGFFLLLNHSVSLSVRSKLLKNENAGALRPSQHLGSFYVPEERMGMQVEYLEGKMLGETVNINEEVVAYKWSLQYDNMEPIKDYHLYFFIGNPIDINANEWLESNLDLAMNEFKKSKGKEYLTVSLPTFYLFDSQQSTNFTGPCIDEYRATKQLDLNDTEIEVKIHRSFLFALIRKEDHKAIFATYIYKPLFSSETCPLSIYSVSSKTISIQEKHEIFPPIAHQAEGDFVFFHKGFIFDAVITQVPELSYELDSNSFSIPYLRFHFKGILKFIDGNRVVSMYAKTHREAKTKRYAIFFVHPDNKNSIFPLSLERFLFLFHGTRQDPEHQIQVQVPPFIAQMNSTKGGLFHMCIDGSDSVLSHDFNWDGHKGVFTEKYPRDVQIFVHDYVTNKLIAYVQFLKPLDSEKCKKFYI